MESLHLSRSVIENLNSFYSKNVSIQKHIQTGKRINKPIDDLGETGKLANLNLERLSNYRTKQNLQNSISFLQSQQGKLKVVTKILTRMGELHTLANSPIANKSTKVIYDAEFKGFGRRCD
jgi:flagellin-like hook-associated protein FlgL